MRTLAKIEKALGGLNDGVEWLRVWRWRHCRDDSKMLSNNLSLDEEDAVQGGLKELEAGRDFSSSRPFPNRQP
jgi:hypothetical protein